MTYPAEYSCEHMACRDRVMWSMLTEGILSPVGCVCLYLGVKKHRFNIYSANETVPLALVHSTHSLLLQDLQVLLDH